MKQYGYLLVAIILIVGLFVLLSPAVSYQLFPQKREALLSSFLSSLLEKKQIDPRKYWELREFYYPGTFTVNKSYSLSSQLIPSVLMPDYMTFKRTSSIQPYLVFRSNKVESFDALSHTAIDIRDRKGKKKYLINNKSLRVSDEGNYYYLIAVIPVSEMKKANGFFQDEGSSPPPKNSVYLTVAKLMKH